MGCALQESLLKTYDGGGGNIVMCGLELNAIKIAKKATHEIYIGCCGGLMGSTVAAGPSGVRAREGRGSKNIKTNLCKSKVYTNPHKGWGPPAIWKPRGGRLGLKPVLQRGDHFIVDVQN